jgi:transcriptional regulator of arginine metabolism
VLARRGFPVTQATLSRDINELGLVRTSEGYTLSNGDASSEPAPVVSRVVREFVREVRRAQNLVVIKTITGSAQPVAFAVDAEGWDEIVGTVAGDDTVLIITPDNKSAKTLQTRLEDMRA